MTKNILSCTILAILSVCLTLPVFAASTLINGAGATFPSPLYAKWFSDYQKEHPDTQINYQPIGSGGGIKQLLDHTVDFGASDAPMTDEQLAKSQVLVLHIPTVLGAVAVTYNVPGIPKGLKLTPEVLADLFLGKITKWNDPKLFALNPQTKFPDTAVLIAHRSDGSGTSAIFTDYLSKVSPEWKQKVGTGTAVNWPSGLGGKGNEGVAGLLKQTPGALGYVELIYAEKNSLAYASIKNSAGSFVEPSLKAVTEAAAGSLKNMPADFRISITNSAGKTAYPISGFTYLLIYQSMPADKGSKLVSFLNWAETEGQKSAAPLLFAPLPEELIQKVKAKIKLITLK